MNFAGLPGAELVQKGLRDLEQGEMSIEALLVSIGSPRLQQLGLSIPTIFDTPEHRLYHLLAAEDEDSAHSRYNALIRRLVSFERIREAADRDRVRVFMQLFGHRTRSQVRVYLVGGSCAVLAGWRPATLAIALGFEPELDAAYRAIADIKDELHVNVELAAPSDFIPELTGWRERSVYIGSEGRADFYHYDFYAQALSKLERGHVQDLQDVASMHRDGLIDASTLMQRFEEIEEVLYRYPALDRTHFRSAVAAFRARAASPRDGVSPSE